MLKSILRLPSAAMPELMAMAWWMSVQLLTGLPSMALMTSPSCSPERLLGDGTVIPSSLMSDFEMYPISTEFWRSFVGWPVK